MREVWDARHLMYELARADLVRHTSRLRLGILWWFLDPLVLALIYWGLVDQLLSRCPASPTSVISTSSQEPL